MANRKKRRQRVWMPPMESAGSSPFNNTFAIDMDNAPDELKLSAKLIEVMMPWIEEVDLPTLSNCAALAWNASVTGIDIYTNQDFLRDGITEDSSSHRALIELLKRRKSKLFPNDMRMIVRMQLQEDEHGEPKIRVFSELSPENFLNAPTGSLQNPCGIGSPEAPANSPPATAGQRKSEAP